MAADPVYAVQPVVGWTQSVTDDVADDVGPMVLEDGFVGDGVVRSELGRLADDDTTEDEVVHGAL